MIRKKMAFFGICFMGASLIKLGLTYILGLRPDPMLASINTIVMGVGALMLVGVLIAESWSKGNDP